MKRLTLVVMLLAFICAACGGEKQTFLNIATGGTAGTYYPIGGALADILNKSGLNAAAQSTGASVANINMLRDNQVELAIVQNDITFYAVNGTEMFEESGKVEGLTAIASLYPETCQFVVRQDSGITTIEQLKGKRVAVGAAGSGAEANARQILVRSQEGSQSFPILETLKYIRLSGNGGLFGSPKISGGFFRLSKSTYKQ